MIELLLGILLGLIITFIVICKAAKNLVFLCGNKFTEFL